MKYKMLPLFIIFLFIQILTINSQDINIIPKPQDFSFGRSNVVINDDTIIINSLESETSAKLLQDHFKEKYSLNLEATEFQSLKKNAINFKVDKNLTNEDYELTISDQGITICALDDRGWFYAVQSLIQYCSSNAYFSNKMKKL